MLINYLKTAIRNLIKTKLFSFINILGLAIGMTACLLILHFVHFEKSYDTFQKDGDRIFRLRYERASDDGSMVRFASCCPPAATFLRDRYPEIEICARMFRYRAAVSFKDQKYIEDRMYFAEQELLHILKFKFITGDPLNGIKNTGNAFISRSTARKYFGDQDPMWKTFSVDKKAEYQVAGVFEDIPSNSHLKFDILLSYKNIERVYPKEVLENWGHTGFYTYLRLKPGADPNALERKLVDLVESTIGDIEKKDGEMIRLKMQPLLDIHLTSHFMQEYEPGGDRDAVNFLAIIAIFIMVIAWVNYINLSTARSLTRAREVGLRKVVGASRLQLVTQFFIETILINLAATLLALFLVKIFLPFFTLITGMPEAFSIWETFGFWLTLVGMFVLGVVLSGLYPVAVLSSFQPVVVLKGKLGNSARGFNLRKALVVFQFVMALVLISGTFAVYRQISFMKNQYLGFDKDQILVVKAPRVRDTAYSHKFETFRIQLLTNPNIKKMCYVTEVPGSQVLWDAGGIRRAGDTTTRGKNYQIVGVNVDFVDVFNLELVAGRNFSREFPADQMGLMVNETAAKWLGFQNPRDAVGQRIDYWDEIYTVVGVLKDYHQQSLKVAFEPHIFRLMPYGRDVRGNFAIKLDLKDITGTISWIQERYDQFFPGNPFDYLFLDEYFNRQYKEDEIFGKVFGIFTFLAVMITALGIFGLSSFIVVQRTKEIGIRKVLGASVTKILTLLVRDFFVLVGIAVGIALPISFLMINRWLEGFAYRMALNVGLFAFPVLIIGVITMATISTHVIRMALANPVDSIRCE